MTGEVCSIGGLVLACIAITAQANGPDHWHLRNPARIPYSLNSVCYGDNLFVAVGDAGTILTSTNGIEWLARTSSLAISGISVTYANQRYLASGSAALLLSTNGMNWTYTTASNFPTFRGIAHGGGIYVGFADFNGKVYSSANGVDWTLRATLGYQLNAITYAFGRFVAVGTAGFSLHSTNGLNWDFQTIGSDTLTGIAPGNNTLVAVNGSSGLYTSRTGTNWATQSVPFFNPFITVAFGNGRFVAAGANGMFFSPDGTNWSTAVVTKFPQYSTGLAAGGGRFVAVGSDSTIIMSTNASQWDHYEAGYYESFWAIAYGATNFAIAGFAGSPLYNLNSPDGESWNATPCVYPRNGLGFGNHLFVGVGDGGTIETSVDGINWADNFAPEFGGLYEVVYGNGRFVAVGNHIFTSTNGSNWVQQSGTAYSVTFGKNLFVAGRGGNIRTSPDGVTWVNQTSLPISGVTPSVAFGNGVFVASTTSGYIYYSSNGTNWTPCLTNTEALYGIGFGRGTFVVTTGKGNVFVSRNGIVWQKRSTGAALRLLKVACGRSRFVAIGDNGLIIESDPMPELEIGPSLSGQGLELSVSGENHVNGCYLQSSTNLVFWENAIPTNIQGSLFLEIDPPTSVNRFYRLYFP